MTDSGPPGELPTQPSLRRLRQFGVRPNRELGQTTLMITHNPEAASVARRILTMRDGEIVREEKGNGANAPKAAAGTPATV